MTSSFKKILYGGDYNPEQWPEDIWHQDITYFKEAHINSATVNVFSWAALQPSEDVYDFSKLDKIIDMLSQENFNIVLATSTAALPSWMFKRYPEVARTDEYGRHHKFGQRHNACPHALVYQKYATLLAEKLAQRYGNNPHIVCWHINNEYGGECYCENCEKAFRIWLKNKYHTLEALNSAWNTSFWGHTIYDWEDIVLPNMLSEGMRDNKTAFAGISIDYKRFNSDSLLENFRMEKEAIRRYDPDTPITTNFMGTYKGLDYFKWAKEIDIISWDNYPSYDTPWSLTAMKHDLMRGLKQAPFMLMEQTPSQQNWQPYNSLKRPKQMACQSYQTLAHGADTIQFFQLRRSVGGCEKFHGAVIAHASTNTTRVFKEVKQLGEVLEKCDTRLLGAKNISEVGIIFDWDNYWAIEYTSGPTIDLTYVDHVHEYYQYFYHHNISVDMIAIDADFSRYKVVVAPLLYMVKPGVKEALDQYVKNGGILVLSYMSGIVDSSDNVILGGYPGPFREMAGIWVEEIDALAPEQENHLIFQDGSVVPCGFLCELIHLEGATALAHYQEDFYQGMPAYTKNSYGQGQVYYLGTRSLSGLEKVLDQVVEKASLQATIKERSDLEITVRHQEDVSFYFLMNFKKNGIQVPSYFVGKKDFVSGNIIEDGATMNLYDTKIVMIEHENK